MLRIFFFSSKIFILIPGSSDGEFGVVKYSLKKYTQTAREDREFKVIIMMIVLILDLKR